MSKERGQSPARRSGNSLFIAFLLTLLTLAVVVGYAVFMGGAQLAKERLKARTDTRDEISLIEIVIDGKPRRMRPNAVVSLIPGLSAALAQRMPALVSETQAQIAAQVDAMFAPALERIPRFTDWYYSLRGEYTRYLEALSADLPGFMAQKLSEEVIAPAGLEEGLDRLQHTLNADLVRRIDAESRWALGTLSEFATAGDQPLETPEYKGRIDGSLQLDTLIRDSLRISEQDLGRKALTALAAVGAGTTVAKGLGAVMVKKLIAKLMGTSGMKLAASLLGKLLVKSSLKSGGSAAAAATGLTLCAPGGLLAIGCGIVAGVAAWVLVDKAFIEIEEALERETFEAELRAAMVAERDTLKQALTEAYTDAIRQHYAAFTRQLVSQTPARLRPAIERRFVPADSAFGRSCSDPDGDEPCPTAVPTD